MENFANLNKIGWDFRIKFEQGNYINQYVFEIKMNKENQS